MKFFKQLHRKFYDATIRTAKPCHESRVDSAVLTVRLAQAHEVIEGLKDKMVPKSDDEIKILFAVDFK